MTRINELEAYVVAVKQSEKERKIGKTLKARMDFHSTPGTVLYNLTDGVGKISLHGVNEMRNLRDHINECLGES